MPDFKDLLTQQVDDAKPPVPLPSGTYQFVILRHEITKRGEKNTDCVIFTCRPLAALTDVDEDLLSQVEGWKEKEMGLTFWLTADSIFMLGDFLKDALRLSTAGRSFMETIPESTNQVFLGHVKHGSSKKNPDRVFSNIDTWAAVE